VPADHFAQSGGGGGNIAVERLTCPRAKAGYISGMKFFNVSLAVLFASLTSAFAQLTVEVVPAQDQYLPDEELSVSARITNLSGQSLHLGTDTAWLKFSVESKDGFIVSKYGEVPVQGEFTLDSSKVGIKHVDLAPYFSLTRAGHYLVTATVHINDWDKDFISAPAVFDVIDGDKLWQQDFGVPVASGEPEVRKYTLQQANYLKHLQLYLRVSDADDSRVFRVQSLGTMVSFSSPEPQVDKASNLHVLWQTGARGFAYRVVNPNGEIIVRQTYDYTATRPRLRVNEEGRIIVIGGVRRFMRDDLPAGETTPSGPEPAPAAPVPVAVPATNAAAQPMP
jgi:hypothetical protein